MSNCRNFDGTFIDYSRWPEEKLVSRLLEVLQSDEAQILPDATNILGISSTGNFTYMGSDGKVREVLAGTGGTKWRYVNPLDPIPAVITINGRRYIAGGDGAHYIDPT